MLKLILELGHAIQLILKDLHALFHLLEFFPTVSDLLVNHFAFLVFSIKFFLKLVELSLESVDEHLKHLGDVMVEPPRLEGYLQFAFLCFLVLMHQLAD